MSRPGDAREHPHQQRGGQAIEGVIREADREEPEHERSCGPPEPDVLVQQVERRNREAEEDTGSHAGVIFLSQRARLSRMDSIAIHAADRIERRSRDSFSICARGPTPTRGGSTRFARAPQRGLKELFHEMRLLICVLFVVSLGTPFVTAAAAQTAGTITGTLSDANGGVLPGVSVTVRDTATGLSRTVVTGAAGRFVVAAIAARHRTTCARSWPASSPTCARP